MMRIKTKSIIALLTVICLLLSPLHLVSVSAAESAGSEAMAENAAADSLGEEEALNAAETEDIEKQADEENGDAENADDPAEAADAEIPGTEDALENSQDKEPADEEQPGGSAGEEIPEGEAAADEGPAEDAQKAEEAAEDPLNAEESAEEVPAEEETEEIPEEELTDEDIFIDEEEDPYVWGGGFYTELDASLRPKPVITYKVIQLKTAVDKNFALDVKGAGVTNGTYVQVYKNNGTDAQKFLLQENSDGTVTLIAYMCGKAVALQSGSTSSGTRIVLAAPSTASSQKFKISKNSDGTVTIKHPSSGKVLELKTGKAVNAQAIQLASASSSSKAQRFYMETTEETTYDYSGNTWVLRTRLNNASVFNVANMSKANSANINISGTVTGKGPQIYKLERYGAYYRIINTYSGKAVDVKSAKTADGTNIQQYTWNGTKAQLWKIRLNDDGSVTFLSALNIGKAASVKGGKTANGTNIQLETLKTSGDTQKFFIVNSDLDWRPVHTANTGATASSAENKKVIVNMIGAVESGSQIYGNQNYGAYSDPYAVSSIEYTITIGWAQNYGDEAKELIQRIFDKDPAAFRKIDKDGKIEAMLAADKDWVKMRWDPSKYETSYSTSSNRVTLKDVIKKLIVTKQGREAQDELFLEIMKTHIAACEKNYTKDVRGVMMFCEIRHLGGQKAVDRIFTRVNGNYSVDSIMASLAMDRLDLSNDNQVGDDKYWSRHEKCKEFIQTYAVP